MHRVPGKIERGVPGGDLRHHAFSPLRADNYGRILMPHGKPSPAVSKATR